MRTLIVYSSLTGNTKMIADAIYKTVSEKYSTEIYSVESAPSADNYDLVFIGFWADRGTADQKSLNYMNTLKNKNVALFFTLGAYPDGKHADDICAKIAEILEQDNNLIGSFRCMGKIDPKILEKSSKHGPMTPERAARIEEAKKHPNEDDYKNAEKFAHDILLKVTR